MNKKLFTLIIFGILLLSSLLVFAEELTEFTNGLTSENLSFAGDENITRNISINKWVNISSVNLNLEGFNNGTSGVYTSNNFININEDNLWSLPGAEFRGTNAILDELNDTSTEKILTFSGDENQTTYLNIPKYAQVNDAFMNLSGFEEISTSHSDAYSCNGIFLSGHPCGDSVDENYSTYAEHDETDSIVYENYSINPSITSGNISSKIGHSLDGVEFDYTFCWNSSGWEPVIKAYSEDAGVVSYTEEIPSSCLNNGDNLFRVKTELNYCFICSGRVYRYYEGNVTWNQRDNSNNSYLEVGTPDGNYEWNQTEELNSTNSPQQTDNFSSSINTYLSSCSEDSEGICQVPLLFHSDSAGLLQTNNININYSNISNVRSDLFSNSLNDILNNTKEPTGACDGGTIDGENCIIPFKFHSDSSGTLEYSDLNVKYDITDVKPPQFTTIPDDEIIEYGNDWVGADFDAEDEGVGIDEWFINDSRFDINQSGYLDTEILGAGTYNVNVSVNDTIGYTNSTIYTLTVERKDLNITADDKTKTYGDSDPSNSVTYSGFVLEDDETNLDGSLNYNRESGEDVGNYDIQPSGQTADNYTLNYYNGTLTINQYPIEITADDKSKTYGESDPELTNTITSGSLQYDDSVIGDLNRDSGEAVGGYNINQGTLNINDGNNGENYDLSFVTGVLTINKAIPSLFLSSPNLISQYLFNNQTELSDNTGRNSGTLHVDATAYYPFNGNSNDESDNSNDGTVNGATLTTDRFGNSDKAYSFDGEDDYVEVSDDDSLDLDSGSFTISYWAYAKDFSGFTRSIDKEDGSNGYAVYHSGDSSSGSYLFSINENNDYRVSTKPLNTFEWHFVTFVYNSPENKLYSYLDGDAKETKTSIPNPNPSTAKLYIGAEDTTDDFFNGSIDEVMILDRPLTDEEVKSLYNITGGRDKFFIKSNAHYPFNGNANDSKGNNDGIVDESYTSLATDRFGESNKSYELDDTDELNKIYIPSSEDKWESGDLTFSIWFKPTNLKQNQYLWDKYNWRFEFSSSHQLRFTIGRCDDPLAGPSYSITSTTTLQNNRWYHATGVYHPDNDTGNGYIKLYLDGDLEDTEDIGSSEIHPDYGNDDLQWGNSMHGHALPFEGSVDESMIFENMLDDTEVQELYNQTNNSYLERESHDLNDIYVDGKVGQGAELWGGGGMQGEDKGKSSYIELDDDLDMPKNNHSLSFWYKTDYDEKKQALFQKTLYSYAGRITLKEDGKIHVESFTNNKWQSDFDTGINPQDGEFHHYSFVFSDTDTKLYVDGELADTQSANDDPDSDIFRYRLFGGSGQEISNYGNGATGTFDDIRIYNKTVSETEVKSIYNNNNGTEATEITAYPNSFSLTSSENNAGDGNSVYNLFVDGNLVDSGNLINYENLKGANTYEIEYNTTGNENYTSNSISSSLLINKGNPIASLTNDRSWSFTYDTTLANIGVSESNIGDGDLNYDIWKDNVNVGSGDSEATAGNYNYKINTTGGVNWSSADNMDANILNISKAIPSLTLSVTNSTYPNNFSINISEDNLGDEDLDYKLFIEDDNVINSSSATYEDLLSVGIYNIKYNTSGGQNYTSNSLTDSFTINKGPTNIDISFYGNGTAVTNNNYTIEAGEELTVLANLNITKTDQILDALFYLYEDGNEVGTLSGNSIEYTNSTLPAGVYYYNSSWLGNENYTATDRDPKVTVEDTTEPTINIIKPENNELFTYNENISLNYTTDDFSGIDKCWYNVKNQSDNSIIIDNTTLINCENTTFDVVDVDSDYNLILYINDTESNLNSETQSFGIRVNAPAINLNHPDDKSFFNYSNNINFNFTATDNDEIDTCKLYSNFNGNWTIDETFNSINSGEQGSTTKNLTEDSLKWNVWCNDTFGNSDFAQSNYTITIDQTSPTLSIINPANNSVKYDSDSITPIIFNHIENDLNTIDTCIYNVTSLDGEGRNINDTTLTDCKNDTFVVDVPSSTASESYKYLLTYKVADEAGNENITRHKFYTAKEDTGGGGATGGGGGTTVITQYGNWTMTADGGGSKYVFTLNPGSKRTKSLYFTNSKTEELELTLMCDGDLCEGLEFEETEFTIPVGQEIKVEKEFNFTMPKEVRKGDYQVNIIAEDQTGAKASVTLDIKSGGGLAIFYEVIDKLTTVKKILNIPVPYLLIFLFVGVLSFIFIGTILRLNKIIGGKLLTIVIAFVISMVVLYLL